MFARISCAACQHKFTIPEGDMGKRHICPNCQTPFLAGKSGAEAVETVKSASGAAPAINKTMLADTDPPIRYNCPRCKKPLESPSIEAGTKKPCPECGQRLQVPAAPPPPAVQPGLNKTLLATDETKAQSPSNKPEKQPRDAIMPQAALNKTMLVGSDPPVLYNCPRCKKPLESPSIEAGTKKPCPECGQRLQIPAASTRQPAGLNKTILASGESFAQPSSVPTATVLGGEMNQKTGIMGRPYALASIVGGGLLFLGLIACLLAMMSASSEREKLALAQKEHANAQKELDDLKKSILQKEAMMAQQKQMEAEQQRKWDTMMAELKAQQRALDLQREADRNNEIYKNDQKLAAQAQEKRRLEQERLEQQEKDRLAERAKFDAQMKAQLDATQKALEAANQRAQQATVIVSQPPVYYPSPWYHPARYYPFGW